LIARGVEHPRQIEQCAESLRGIEVIVHRHIEPGPVRADLRQEAAVGARRRRPLAPIRPASARSDRSRPSARPASVIRSSANSTG
jgi:hypothetical protein